MLLAATKFPTGSKEVGYKMMSADVVPDGRLGFNNGTIATFTEEIAALEKGIKNLVFAPLTASTAEVWM